MMKGGAAGGKKPLLLQKLLFLKGIKIGKS